MKVADLLESSIDVDFRQGSIGIKSNARRVPIYNVEQRGEDEFVFVPTRTWKSRPLTVKADSADDAYKQVRDRVQQKVMDTFGRAGQNAQRISKRLGMTN